MAPLTLSGLPDVRFFVLGPPREKKYINKSRPSSRDSEVYLGAAVIAQALALSNAADPGATDSWQPFHPAYRVAYDDPDIAAIRQRYNDDQLIWRQIGQSWLPAAGELALDLDSHTNNTSLVLAIELSPGGKVLLFPGDAQVGNWLSWHEVQWPEADAGLTAADLLGRTVFYKVGHHGSHNATLQGRGLELMTSPELAAFVPVELAMAEKRSWSMPYPPLYERLNELTAGRVALTDARQPVITEQLPADFAAQLREEKLYVDVTIHGRSKPG
jgi:hypothetical protein